MVGLEDAAAVTGRVLRRTITIGGQYLLLIAVGGATLRARVASGARFAPGETVSVLCPTDHLAFFRSGQRLADQPAFVGG